MSYIVTNKINGNLVVVNDICIGATENPTDSMLYVNGNTTIDNNNYDNINNAKILIENNGIIQNISSQEFSNIIDKGVSSIYDYNGISYQKYFLHNVDIADNSNQTRLYIDGENETKNFNIHKFTSYFLNTRTNSFMGKFASGNVNCSHSYIVLNRKAAYGTIPKKLNVVHHNLFLISPNASSTEYEIVTDVSNKKYYLAPKCYNEDSNDCTKGIAFLNSIETKFSDNLTSNTYNKTTTIDTNTTLKNYILKGTGSSNVVLYIDGSSSLITLDSNIANSIYIQILSRSNITNNKTNSFIFTAIVKNQSIKKILKETIYAETENDTIDLTINGSNQIILTCNSSVSHRWIAHINILEIKDTTVTNTIYKELNWFNSLNCNELIYLKNRGTGSVTLYTNGTSNEYTVDKYTSIDTKIRIIGISGNLICAYYYKGIIKRLNGNITILLVKNRLTPSNINWSTSITRSGTNTVRISCTGENSTATTWYAEIENNINIFNYE
jgi:hypothetical protein